MYSHDPRKKHGLSSNFPTSERKIWKPPLTSRNVSTSNFEKEIVQSVCDDQIQWLSVPWFITQTKPINNIRSKLAKSKLLPHRKIKMHPKTHNFTKCYREEHCTENSAISIDNVSLHSEQQDTKNYKHRSKFVCPDGKKLKTSRPST